VDYTVKQGCPQAEKRCQSDATYREFPAEGFTQANGVMKPGPVFLHLAWDFRGYNVRAACIEAGWKCGSA
jgi:hypothetical protein